MLQSTKVFEYAFTSAASATATVTQNFPSMDLSHAEALMLEMEITAAAAAASDTIECKLQETSNGTNWNSRARTTTIAGNATVSASAPEYVRATLNQVVDLASTEEFYEPSGSAGASEITAGTVINGPFPGKVRSAASGWTASWRIVLTKTDGGGNDAAFSGTVRVFAVTRN